LQQFCAWYFNKPRPADRKFGAADSCALLEWERIMFDLVVTHWFRLFSALIGGSAGLKAAEEVRRVADAKAAEEARLAAEAKAAEEARRVADAKAAEAGRGVAKAKAVEAGRGGTKAKAVEAGRRVAEAKAAEEARRVKPKAAEDAPRVVKSKAAEGTRSAAAIHPGKRPEEMVRSPTDFKLNKGIVAKPTGTASQKAKAPRVRAK
jgi:hypothetical protein